jgi:hypothetical protein
MANRDLGFLVEGQYMENFGINKPPSGQPAPFNNDASHAGHISHAPLDLGGGAAAPKPVQPAAPTAVKPVGNTVAAERITGVKTFFTKLHAGAIEFLDEVIAKWLKENPEISIKLTNVITGEIQGKKTEPNIIITVWY